MSSFYCQQKCGVVGFSIEEWHKNYLEIEKMPISRADKDKLIDGEPCENQCFDCIAIVGETRILNKEKRKARASKQNKH